MVGKGGVSVKKQYDTPWMEIDEFEDQNIDCVGESNGDGEDDDFDFDG